MSSKLIIIRGNSGSGKTTIAKEVRNRLGGGLGGNTLLIQQDTLRREMLKEPDELDKYAILELLEILVEFGRKQKRTVIVEGIFSARKYGDLLSKLGSKFDKTYAYYFDLPFDETLARHESKPNAHEFGEKEMREWWKEKDYLGMFDEKILYDGLSIDDIASEIMNDLSK